MKDLKIGDEVFYAVEGRYGREHDTETYKITKIGRIYYYIGEGYREKKIEIKTNREKRDLGYCGNAYKNEQEFKEKIDRELMIRWFRNDYVGFYYLDYQEIKSLYDLARKREAIKLEETK